MVNTLLNILFLELLDGFHDQTFVADVQFADELSGPQCFEVPLELTEHELDRVEVRSVRQVVDEAELEPSHLCL